MIINFFTIHIIINYSNSIVIGCSQSGKAEDVISVIKRARNHKSGSHPKSCDIVTYKYATGFEEFLFQSASKGQSLQ